MQDVDVRARPPAVEGPAPRRRRRWVRWLVAAFVVAAAAGAIVVWFATRPPKPVSVTDVVDRFRNAPAESTGEVADGPKTGVYVFATTGSERISAGVTHHYPARTTLTVTKSACGLNARWDALAGRYMKWQLCRTGVTWSLAHYVDAHKFLYLQDVHSYTCHGYPTVVCDTASGVLTNVVRTVGPEPRTVAGRSVDTTHLRITQTATGKSLSDGVIDVWVLPSGLPVRLVISDHGSQEVLGSQITYTESATFTLSSLTPRR